MPTGPLQTTLYVPNTEAIVKFGKDFSIGGWSAVVAKTLCAPVERIKLILQVNFRLSEMFELIVTLKKFNNPNLFHFYHHIPSCKMLRPQSTDRTKA